MSKRYLYRLGERRIPETIGNKAQNLRRLQRMKYPVPETIVCTWDAYLDYCQHPARTVERLSAELPAYIRPIQRYAVRSSANIEDGTHYSFAGQFQTYLDVKENTGILNAIQGIWEAVRTDGLQTYLHSSSTQDVSIYMAVLIQHMVSPVVSGVAFSKNPLTGLDEIVVEAVEGPGTQLVQDGISPQRWVNKWGTWLEQPPETCIRSEIIQEVVHQTQKIAKSMGQNVDLEWVFDGQNLYWVQMRTITALKGINIYSNRISKEMLPGMIKPLVWSVCVPLAVSQKIRLVTELVGKHKIDPDSVVKAFYYRAYFDMASFGQIFTELGLPPESLEMMLGILPPGAAVPSFKPGPRILWKLPRLLRFFLDKWLIARRLEKEWPQIERKYRALADEPLERLTPSELLNKIENLKELHKQVTYYSMIVPILMSLYHAIWKRHLKAVGVDFQDFDLLAEFNRITAYDPGSHLALLNRLFNQLTPKEQLFLSGKGDCDEQTPELINFQMQFATFLDQFGHLSDSGTDFSHPLWREQPDLLLNLIISYPQPPSTNKARVVFPDLKLNPLQHFTARLFYERARHFRLYREMTSSFYTFGLGLFRRYYLAIAQHLVDNGVLADCEQIFYLYAREVREASTGQQPEGHFTTLADERRQSMENSEDVILPGVIFGQDPPPLVHGSRQRLFGTPTSHGYYTGKACIVRSLSEFEKVEPGDILIIPYSDVGWTPLFAKAGAVLSESGGMLSHSSIIAREYGIPAVVSVAGVLALPDGIRLSVNGYSGEVIVQDNAPDQKISTME